MLHVDLPYPAVVVLAVLAVALGGLLAIAIEELIAAVLRARHHHQLELRSGPNRRREVAP